MSDSKIVDLSKAQTEKFKKEMLDRLVDKIGDIDKRREEIDDKKFQEALQLIQKHAFGDHGGGKRCAMFLLSLWHGNEFKADLRDLMWVDPDVFEAMIYVMNALFYRNYELGSVLPEKEIDQIIDLWGDDLRS